MTWHLPALIIAWGLLWGGGMLIFIGYNEFTWSLWISPTGAAISMVFFPVLSVLMVTEYLYAGELPDTDDIGPDPQQEERIRRQRRMIREAQNRRSETVDQEPVIEPDTSTAWMDHEQGRR